MAECLVLCRFSAAGMTVSPRTPRAGGRKAPRQEIAGWERRWCRNYGDFAAGSGVDVAERGGNVGNFCHAAWAMGKEVVSPLRQRMIEDMNARKLAKHSQRSHIHSCKRFAALRSGIARRGKPLCKSTQRHRPSMENLGGFA
jgi:predicted oxidoreductase